MRKRIYLSIDETTYGHLESQSRRGGYRGVCRYVRDILRYVAGIEPRANGEDDDSIGAMFAELSDYEADTTAKARIGLTTDNGKRR